ncbi:MAG: hypothetical protein FWH37_02050 [Candidatus Bathyarchaeota archaeon]|nr:hypothetical protein [Candidatus Termiticorpusculum sp.]
MSKKYNLKLHGLPRNFLSLSLLTVLMVSLITPCMLMAHAEENPVSIDITLSLQIDGSGFAIPKQTIAVTSDLAEQYGYTDAYDGLQVTVLDALVAAHIMVFGDNQVDVNNALTVADGGFVTNFMGDGWGNFVFFVNSVLPLDLAGEIVLQDGDDVQFFAIQDLDWYSDTYAWFEYENVKVDTLTVAVDEEFDLTVMGTVFAIFGDWGAFDDVVDGAGVVLVDDATGSFIMPLLAVTDDFGVATLCFDTVGTYVLGAVDVAFSMESPLMSPWLVVTVEEPQLTLVDVSVDASVEWLNGPQNRLFITVTETFSDGSTKIVEWDGLINNNAADTYVVGNYQVFVDTKGNTQIRECYIVDCHIVV